jgi:hypothetical protein
MMKVKPATPQDVINLLNAASRLDRAAIRTLVDNYVRCNCGLADHPMIPVGVTEDGEPQIGMLGIINGLYGVDEDAHGPVVANIPDDPAEPVIFSRNPNFEE